MTPETIGTRVAEQNAADAKRRQLAELRKADLIRRLKADAAAGRLPPEVREIRPGVFVYKRLFDGMVVEEVWQ